jgi:hypothetical protein
MSNMDNLETHQTLILEQNKPKRTFSFSVANKNVANKNNDRYN